MKRKNRKTGSIASLCVVLAVALYAVFFRNSSHDVPAKRPRTEQPKAPGAKGAPQSVTTFTGKVIGIKDGDTFEVLYDGQPERVRLAEIDSPEKSQPFGNNAKQYASGLCFGKIVTVSSDGKRDRYGRIVGTVVTKDGKNVNEELLKAGLAWHYKQYSDNENLGDLEDEARLNKEGLWADKKPVPPWEWRKKKRRKHK